VVAEEFADLGIPVVTVLGNHDYHSDSEDEIIALLRESGMTVLDGTSVELDLPGGRLGVAGGKGFGGGLPHRSTSEFGEPEMKAFVRHSADFRVALTHYSPVAGTLAGGPPRSIRSSAATFLPRRRTALMPTSAFTATRTQVPNTAPLPPALPSGTWCCPCSSAPTPSTALVS
jgi:hypothetical protein